MARIKTVRVCDIILSNTHERYTGAGSIGTILYNGIKEMTPIYGKCTNSKSAKPLWKTNRYPVANEVVMLIKAPTKYYNDYQNYEWYYMPPVSIHGASDFNGLPNQINKSTNSYYTGRYYKENPNHKNLMPYEGDVIHEGRFGNSIRFSSTVPVLGNPWSEETNGNTGDPITIIRNGQKTHNLSAEVPFILEDINEDDSSIYLCSRQRIKGFVPASKWNESYGVSELENTDNQDELEIMNNEMDSSVVEDVELNEVNNLPSQELVENDELEGASFEIDTYDMTPTEIVTDQFETYNVPFVLTANFVKPEATVHNENDDLEI